MPARTGWRPNEDCPATFPVLSPYAMAFHLYDTMQRSLVPFEPLEAGKVRMYTCGPTVYNHAHIGNFRAYMFEDLLRRHLKSRGYQLTHVMNLTDVDDKTIRGALAEGKGLKEYTQPFIEAFFRDLDLLGIERAEHYPAATDHIAEMIVLIQRLLDTGHAYQAEDGSVYFSIARFEGYGKLSHLDLSGMQVGARVDQDEYEKETAADFALWKAWTEKDGDVAWEAPWGRGRPGWHIECSAMSMKYLGDSFDLHTGGMDNMFPHHEDEIAQSEAATGASFSRYWMHCAHLVVEGRKMSKSLGNFFTLQELLEQGWSGREIRYVLIGTHYRQTLNFCTEALQGARAALERLDAFTGRLRELAGDATAATVPSWADGVGEGFLAALDDDLNISAARAVIFDLVRDGHKALDAGGASPEEAAAVLDLFTGFDQVLGFLGAAEEEADEEAVGLAAARQAAREARDWAGADRLRDLLDEKGWLVQDTPKGPKLKRKS